jgi:hypothetical protein
MLMVMHPPLRPVQIVAGLWFFACVGAFLTLHFRLVRKLEEFGVRVPYLLQNQPWVEWKYVQVCREKQIDPWPPIRRLIACWLLGMAGVVVFLVMLAR